MNASTLGERNAVVSKMVALLSRVPIQDRARFARVQLGETQPEMVATFDRLSPEDRRRAVLYIAPVPHSREIRLATAARQGGWLPFLVHSGPLRYDALDAFQGHFQLSSAMDLVLASWLFPGALVHLFVLHGGEGLIFGRLKPRRLVLDTYDTGSGMLSLPRETRDAERTVIGAVDGITHRDLRIQLLRRLHGYRLPKYNVFIHDPLQTSAAEDAFPPADGEIHVASVGWVGTGDSSILRVAKALCGKGIHLHVYFNFLQNKELPEYRPYLELAESSPFFHIEATVTGGEYYRRLSQCQFGLSINERFIFCESPTDYTPDYLAGCGSSRLSDYIALNLGVIVSPGLRFQHFWARRYAVVTVDANLEFLSDPVPKLVRALEERRRVDRGAVSVNGAAARLTRFYTKVAA